MATRSRRGRPRGDALSRERIVAAAIEMLDEEGEGALTFRQLTARLGTGSGAIYWHVADKEELLAAAADVVVARAVAGAAADLEPRESIRAVALGVFDAFNAHPWLGAQLARVPWQPAVLHLFEGVGLPLQALGVPYAAQFNAATALVSYFVALAAQHAAATRLQLRETDRPTFLAAIAAQWSAQYDSSTHPFVHHLAEQLAEHDDREQFIAGLELILAGIDTLREE
ncbi:TetR family transcriptional regulator [Mycobacterium sp. MS1601]|uniref:TetR/AcrR family transcriptional regulator n=1 Tax=Mycobacterium sp. MS1601 TaxID=1936029 RepID=UPI0009792B6B|nr:helix-turn-helix domain-containing protein [Mycobacterium sp. MS1601]AQA06782.1 TetR family transcriptional regulator [Mycobacterium sp. MS1601]